MMPADPPTLILASSSKVRASLLAAAGVGFTVEASAVDEEEIKRSLRAEGADVATAADALALAKAQRVSRRHPGALVIGADQILDCNGTWFDKPPDMAHARAQLTALRARPHSLATAVCVVRNGERIWHARAQPRLTMRTFGPDFLDRYLEREGPAVLSSVGAYRLEGLGVQLFSAIDGDHFAILGLPLLPLLEFLRQHGVVER